MDKFTWDLSFTKLDLERIRKTGYAFEEAILSYVIDYSKKHNIAIDQPSFLKAYHSAKDENNYKIFRACGILFRIKIETE